MQFHEAPMSPENLPQRLLSRARKYGGDLAWERSDALDALMWWREHDVAVVGVEVWIGFEQHPVLPSVSVYAFASPERRPGESHPEYVNRTCEAIHQYVAHFSFDPTDDECKSCTPLFCFTTE
jgi:hypothetical protein